MKRMKNRLGITVVILATAVLVNVGGAIGATTNTAELSRPSASGQMAARGNETKYQLFVWGARIWLSHNTAIAAWQSVSASGNFSNLDKIPGVPPLVKSVLQHISCISQFVNDVRSKDVGYGVVMDVNWWAPFWSCGTLKVWSQ
jgi:hypothetical protein